MNKGGIQIPSEFQVPYKSHADLSICPLYPKFAKFKGFLLGIVFLELSGRYMYSPISHYEQEPKCFKTEGKTTENENMNMFHRTCSGIGGTAKNDGKNWECLEIEIVLHNN